MGTVDKYVSLLLAVIDFVGILAPGFFMTMKSFDRALQRGENPFIPALLGGFFGVLVGIAVVAGVMLSFEEVLKFPARYNVCKIVIKDETVCSKYR